MRFNQKVQYEYPKHEITVFTNKIKTDSTFSNVYHFRDTGSL